MLRNLLFLFFLIKMAVLFAFEKEWFAFEVAEYRGGNGRSYSQGYEGLETVLGCYCPALQSCSFLDIEVMRVDKRRLAVNSGIGWRTFYNDFENVVGLNAFYDFRHFSRGDLHQWGLGLELLGPCFDLRANAYIPFGKKLIFIDADTIFYPGGFFAERNRFHHAMWGLDIEIGRSLFCNSCFDIYGAIGPYFYQSRCCKAFLGGMGRIGAHFWRYWTVEFYWTYDRLFKFRPQGELSFLIPISTLADCFSCLYMPIERNRIIVVDKICKWKTNF